MVFLVGPKMQQLILEEEQTRENSSTQSWHLFTGSFYPLGTD